LSKTISEIKSTNKIFLLAIVLISFIFFNSAYHNKNTSLVPIKENTYLFNPLSGYDFKQLRDTVYTDKDNFIEVNLATQQATLYLRDGSKIQFPISSGTKKVEKGMDTNEGLFAIQWKAKKLYSSQFDSTVMLYWMGFNNGIGFHALEGKSYYKYLGKKNVSHGCVRVSREDAEIIYNKVKKGTPVLIHKENSAIKIAFTSEGESYNQYSYSETYRVMKNRYQKLYDGEYLISSDEKLLIDENNIYSSGLPIGNSELIPTRQNLKPSYLWVDKNKSEEERLSQIFSGKEKSDITLNPFLDSRNNKF